MTPYRMQRLRRQCKRLESQMGVAQRELQRAMTPQQKAKAQQELNDLQAMLQRQNDTLAAAEQQASTPPQEAA